MGSAVRSIRFPEEVFTLVEEEAEKLGLRPSDVVVHAVRRYLELPADPGIELMACLKSEVEGRWGPDGFPQDVTLQLFRLMRSAQKLFDQYQQAITSHGQLDEHRRAQIHRRIGKMVKQVLRARVVGRSLPLDRNEELIETHSLLVPSER